MSAFDEKININIRFYQKCIEVNSRNGRANSHFHILNCIQELDSLPIEVHHLQATGVGKTINALRTNFDGDIQNAATDLVWKWKEMVMEQLISDTESGGEEEDYSSNDESEDIGSSEEVNEKLPVATRKMGISESESELPINSTRENPRKQPYDEIESIQSTLETLVIGPSDNDNKNLSEEPVIRVNGTVEKVVEESERKPINSPEEHIISSTEKIEITEEDTVDLKEQDGQGDSRRVNKRKDVDSTDEAQHEDNKFHCRRPKTIEGSSTIRKRSYRKRRLSSKSEEEENLLKKRSKNHQEESRSGRNRGLACCLEEVELKLQLKAELQHGQANEKCLACTNKCKDASSHHQICKHLPSKEETKAKTVYSCTKCSYTDTDLEVLNQHQTISHARMFACDKCEYKGSQQTSLKQHQEAKHPTFKTNWANLIKCEECEFVGLRDLMATHVRFKHGTNVRHLSKIHSQ